MFDESSNTHSAADFKNLMRECFQLMNSFPAPDRYKYSNIATLSDEYGRDMSKLNTDDLALVFGRNQKINFIKEIRSRYKDLNGASIGLLEAKLIADGIWTRKGW